ncbi:MAG: hypothetical protein AAF791_11265 [Bacteroidota bacterium]
MTFRLSFRRLAVLAGVLVPFLAACDEGVGGTQGTDQVFTIWGYLDPTIDQQAIRVVPISDRIDAEASDAIDAEVTVTNVATNEVVALRDSLVTFDTGESGFVFIADWTPSFGQMYRLEARRSDGRVASVEVEIPPLVDAEVGEAVSTLGDVTYPFAFTGAPNVFAAQIDLIVQQGGGDTTRLSVPFPAARGAENEVAITFASTVRGFLTDRQLVGSLQLIEAELVAFVANEEWDVPTGRFDDTDAIVEPGTVSNVTDGFGFVGGGYFTRTSFVPSVNTQIRAGFGASEDAAARIRINEVSTADGWVELYNPLDEVVSIGGYSIADASTGGQQTVLPGTAAIGARGFFVVDLTFDIDAPQTLYFRNGAGREVLQRNLVSVETGRTFGSYPDGRQLVLRIGDDAQDLMGGALIPTRGQPNEPEARPVLLNEIYTAGTGWAEVFRPLTSDVTLRNVRVITSEREVLSRPTLPLPTPGGLAVADESAGAGLVLEQQSGEVLVLAGYSESPDPGAPVRFRVVDVRAYGLQNPDLSEGRMPDGGPWQADLLPTRGAPNATSRPF